jgi:hypothetical protein
MNATQIIEVVKLVIDGRKMASKVGISRDPVDNMHDLYATLYNADGFGKKEVLLASLESSSLAVEVRNRINMGI